MATTDLVLTYIQLFQLLGLSAVVSGGVSTLVNYIINIRDFKKKNKIKQLEEKIELYSYLIFQLDRMRFAWHAIETMEGRRPEDSEFEGFVYPDGEDKEMISEMNKRIEKGYHLFKQDIMKDWAYISNLFFHPTTKPKVPQSTEFSGFLDCQFTPTRILKQLFLRMSQIK